MNETYHYYRQLIERCLRVTEGKFLMFEPLSETTFAITDDATKATLRYPVQLSLSASQITNLVLSHWILPHVAIEQNAIERIFGQ